MRCPRSALAVPLLLIAATGCVEALDRTALSFSRNSPTTLRVTVDEAFATVQSVNVRIYRPTGALLPMTAAGDDYTRTYYPDPCSDFVTLRYEITYDDNNDGTTKTKYEPADGYYYKRLWGTKPPGCGASSTYAVNSTLDVPDAYIGDGVCYAGPPANGCTLRAAIQEANSDSAADLITLPAGTYTLTRAGFDDVADVGDLDIRYDVMIRGASRGLTTIQSDIRQPIFDIRYNFVDMSLRYVTLDGLGDAQPIYNRGALRIDGVIIRGGYVQYGGGGCIRSTGYLDMERVEIHDCYAGLGTGGAIRVDAGTARIRKASLHDNFTVQHGGAISVIGTGSLLLEDATLYDNTASVYGGGLHANGDRNVDVRNTTIVGNRAFASGARGEGGGIFMGGGDGQLTISNTIIANNLRNGFGNDPTSDCEGELTTLGGNLVGVTSADCVIDETYTSGNDIVGDTLYPADPDLANVAGWPPAWFPSSTSPVLGAGTSGAPNQANYAQCTREDQHGRDRTSAGACHIGAIQSP